MTDRELLELAAKAVGYFYVEDHGTWFDESHIPVGDFNPLGDSGDALRLAVSLCMNLEITESDVYACCRGNFSEPAKPDSCASMRRAIVRAAAEIGRSMP